MVESLDENIGRVLATLDRLNLRDNTILLFFSDNGGLSTGSSQSSVTSILPNKAGKAWVYEGGIRVPLIMDYPWPCPKWPYDLRACDQQRFLPHSARSCRSAPRAQSACGRSIPQALTPKRKPKTRPGSPLFSLSPLPPHQQHGTIRCHSYGGLQTGDQI